MSALFLTAAIFVAGLVTMAQRSAASGQAPQLVLGALPLALLFLPAQQLHDLWQFLATFKEIARTQTGGTSSVMALSIEHHRLWVLASWLVVVAMITAGITQQSGLRFGASTTLAKAADDRSEWSDLVRAASPVMVAAVALVAVMAQRTELAVLAFLAAVTGVESPPHAEAQLVGASAARGLGGVIGRDAVLTQLGAAMTIVTLLVLAYANIVMRRPDKPWPWLTAYAWAVLAVISSLGAINASRLSAVADWGERVMPVLPGP